MSFRRRYRHIDWAKVNQLKELLNTFFKALRADGFIARQNFSCCQGCGFSEISSKVENDRNDGKTYNGVVFYHRQDNAGVDDGSGTYLSHSPASEDADDDARKLVGRRVAEIAKSCGLKVEWEGENPNQRIWVEVPPKPPTFLGEGI